jgi:hypothetical protein
MAPMYGGGALVIREAVRRAGRGWPSILALGLAYGVLEEGLVTQSLFNRDYAGLRLLDPAYIPALGIGAADGGADAPYSQCRGPAPDESCRRRRSRSSSSRSASRSGWCSSGPPGSPTPSPMAGDGHCGSRLDVRGRSRPSLVRVT